MHEDACPKTYAPDLLGCICGKVCKPYLVEMKDVTTGETVICKMDWTWGEGSEYIWSEGGWSCDCNRQYEFREAKGLPRMPEGDTSRYCLGSHKYQILGIRLMDGTLVYEAEEPPEIKHPVS
jgi:hypothetical protein